MLGTAAGRLLSLASLAVLARLLAPADFGLFAFALVYVTYLEIVGNLGMGSAIIYWPDRTHDVAQITFCLNLLAGAALCLLTWLLAPAISEFFHSPNGVPILRAFGVALILRALGNTHDALCKKELRFKARLLPEIGLASVKAAVTIGLALAGFGVWSLVWGHLAATAARAALLWVVVPWRPAWRWPADLVRPVLRYGGWILVVGALGPIVHHLDYVIVGRMLGLAALGFYQMAYKIPEAVVIVLVWQTSMVLFPTFAKVQAAGRSLRDTYLGALRYFAVLAVPAALSLCLLAEPLVLTLFGEAWRPSIPVLRALAVYSGLRALGTYIGDALKAQGRPGLLAALASLKAVVLVPALVVAARWGITAVAVTLATVAAGALVLELTVLRRTVGIPLRSVLAGMRPTLAPATVLVLVLLGWAYTTAGTVSPPIVLVGGLGVGLGAYLLTLWIWSPDLYRDAVARLVARPGAGGPVASAVARSPR